MWMAWIMRTPPPASAFPGRARGVQEAYRGGLCSFTVTEARNTRPSSPPATASRGGRLPG